jgi:phosphoglycolate phosphatase
VNLYFLNPINLSGIPMEKMGIKVVIFDWSGTISDDCLNTYNAAIKMRKHFGIPHNIPIDEWKKTTEANVIDFFKSRGIKEGPEKIMKLFQKYYAENDFGPKPFVDAEELLSFLKTKGKNITIVSAHPHIELQNEIEEYGFGGFIDQAIGSVRNKSDKLKLLSEEFMKSGIEKSEIAYIGDTSSDIMSAKEAGIMSIAIVRGYHSEEKLKGAEPDLVINSLEELKEAIH